MAGGPRARWVRSQGGSHRFKYRKIFSIEEPGRRKHDDEVEVSEMDPPEETHAQNREERDLEEEDQACARESDENTGQADPGDRHRGGNTRPASEKEKDCRDEIHERAGEKEPQVYAIEHRGRSWYTFTWFCEGPELTSGVHESSELP